MSMRALDVLRDTHFTAARDPIYLPTDRFIRRELLLPICGDNG
jgi:hypothetical protein